MKKTSLFVYEDRILTEAENKVNSNEYIDDPLSGDYGKLAKAYEKVLMEYKKTVKISDGQQQYLRSIQEQLKKEIAERMKMEEKLAQLATYDSLTGVYNRGAGLLILEEQLKVLQRCGGIFSICFVDVDNLKWVNDHYGHQEGDRMICLICDAFRDIIRDCDTIFRTGGDEFLIILGNCNSRDGEAIVHRVIGSQRFEEFRREKPYEVSFSFGLIEVDRESRFSVDELIVLSDQKMYEHKQRLSKCRASGVFHNTRCVDE